MSAILLGLYDGYMSQRIDTLTSETKIGGRPTFFPALSAEQRARIEEWTTCNVCGHTMFLLLQAYSPLPSAPPTMPHHRMLYVFACNSSSCARQPSSSWVSFSLHVNREDEGGSDEAEYDEETDDLTSDGTRPLPATALPPHCFPPCHVYIEAEPDKAVFVPTNLEKELIAKAEARLSAMAEDCEGDGGDMTEKDLKELEETVDLKDKRSDYLYEKFRARVARAPTQVLRYHQRRSGEGVGEGVDAAAAVVDTTTTTTVSSPRPRERRPLFMNPDKVKRMIRVPACTSCGAALVHEIQIMPTSLYYLRVSEYVAERAHKAAKRERQPSSADNLSGPSAETTATTATITASPQTTPTTTSASCASGKPAADTSASRGDEGVDFSTATVYVCSRDCALQASTAAALASDSLSGSTSKNTVVHKVPPADTETSSQDDAIVVVLRREFVCVESPPTLEEEKQEKKLEDRARADGATRKDLRELLEAADSDDEDDEPCEGDVEVAKNL